jgi:class 3 adenylate cyclase
MSDIAVNPKASRRLAAILAADIAGYSALMGSDEEATVRDLKGHQAVVLPMVKEHGGRIIDTIGMARARAKIGLMNLVYNMRRLVQLERMAAASA